MLDESQVFRIDHFLGKETVQNIMVLRFANGIFEPLWNRHYIDHVQITVAETVGVEERGGFYEPTGALRDMVPNHLFQLLAITAMEPPSYVRGGRGARREGEGAPGDQADRPPRRAAATWCAGSTRPGGSATRRSAATAQEPDVARDSRTETYVAMRLMIDNWRWAGVPFYLRTGKRADRAPHRDRDPVQAGAVRAVPRHAGAIGSTTEPSWCMHIQPERGHHAALRAPRCPGPKLQLGRGGDGVPLRRLLQGADQHRLRDPALRLMIGDATLFQRADMVEAGWAVVQPILDTWAAARVRGRRAGLLGRLARPGGGGPRCSSATDGTG